MKVYLLLIGTFLTHAILAQMGSNKRYLDENHLKDKGIAGYTVRGIQLEDKDSYIHGLVLERAKFNNDGKETFHYFYNFDVVNNTDSLINLFDSVGNIIKTKTINHASPEGKEQIAFLEDFGGEKRIGNKEFTYDDLGRLVQVDDYSDIQFNTPDTDKYYYDDNGLKYKHEAFFSLYPQSSNYEEYFHYDSNGNLIQTDLVYLNQPSDTLHSTSVYNANKKLEKEIKKTNLVEEVTEYSYNNQGLLASTKSTGTQFGSNYEYEYQYLYNSENLVSEVKAYNNRELRSIRRFEYNDQGLKTKENWVDIESGEVIPIAEIQYEYSISNQHLGRWIGEDKGDVGIMSFDSEGKATIEINGFVLGGEDPNDSRRIEYSINYQTDPIQIDMVIIDQGKEFGRLRGILTFIDRDQMKMALQFDPTGERPTSFEKDSLTLTRVKD